MVTGPNGSWRDYPQDCKEKYAAYLCSREWGLLKRQVHERSGGKCERCFRNPLQAVHHKNYLRKYAEELEDLQAICNACHDFEHGRSDFDPAKVADPVNLNPSALLQLSEGGEVVCPRCKDCFVHLGGVLIEQNRHITKIENCITTVSTRDSNSGDRGSGISLSLQCECGYVFGVCLGFHKGTTSGYLADSINGEPLPFTELWRD